MFLSFYMTANYLIQIRNIETTAIVSFVKRKQGDIDKSSLRKMCTPVNYKIILYIHAEYNIMDTP